MNSQQAALALMHILNIRFVTQGLGIWHGGRRSSSLELYNVTFLWKCTVRAYQRICLHSSSWLRFTLCWRQGCCQCRRWCHLRRRHCWQVRGQRGSGWWQHGRRVTGAENILVSASWLAINEVGSTWWKGFSFLLQKFCSPPSISSYGRRALPLHSFGGWGQALPGVQGERKGGANGEREGEDLLMAGQRMAEIHALGGQRKIHRSHFLGNIWIKKMKEQARDTCCFPDCYQNRGVLYLPFNWLRAKEVR